LGLGAGVTERELQKGVIDCARLFGWRVAHFRPAQTARGWRTPVEADGAGFPDLVLVRDGRLIFAELKSGTGKLGDAQQVWLDALELVNTAHVCGPCIEVYVWKPDDWTSGRVEQTLAPRNITVRGAAA
jgi:hypothetical protein